MKTTLALFTAALVMAPHLAMADSGVCTTEKTAGTYGFSLTGTVLPGNASGLPVGPVAATGLLVLEPNGEMHGSEQIIFNGVIVPGVQYGGTFTVNPDCTLTLEDPGFFRNYGVIVSDGNELLVMSSDTGVITTATAKRIQKK
ncbi:MAG TPA: hypothetical protein VIG99_12520 [Myxococcaceae bacterium]|jgi:hypothetical protein